MRTIALALVCLPCICHGSRIQIRSVPRAGSSYQGHQDSWKVGDAARSSDVAALKQLQSRRGAGVRNALRAFAKRLPSIHSAAGFQAVSAWHGRSVAMNNPRRHVFTSRHSDGFALNNSIGNRARSSNAVLMRESREDLPNAAKTPLSARTLNLSSTPFANGSLCVVDDLAAEGHSKPKRSADPLVMYILLRQDLDWPMGALMNQACHACVAVAWEARDDKEAQMYMSATGSMIKYTMGAKNEQELLKVGEKLKAAEIPFKLWVEQPENVTVCLATWPRPRSTVQKCFKSVKRF